MNEQQLRDLLSTLNLYTSFFFLLIVLCFASFVAVLFSLIHNIKNRKKLQKNREFISEIIQTQEAERNRISRELHDTVSQNIKTLLLKEKELSAILSDSDRSNVSEELMPNCFFVRFVVKSNSLCKCRLFLKS